MITLVPCLRRVALLQGNAASPRRKALAEVQPSCQRTVCGSDRWATSAAQHTGLQVYNSLSKRKEALTLAREGVATWYSCGPTVYDHAHLGHACSYVRFDILQRILSRFFGINVIHAMVITDIDDKIIKRGLADGISPFVLARMYEEEFKNDMLAMNVLPPTVYMRVTDNIPRIVDFIQGIIKNGHAYATSEGSVYFDVKSVEGRYGKLFGMRDVPSETGEAEKRDARDFALWKASKPQEPHWESPWGQGRPGWHIECSTIASSVFGSQLDIHSGGIDLAFPHHENEIAQCEAYHQCQQWGNYFLHSGHLHLKGSSEKMSKSLKNYVTIKDFLQSYTADEFRMFCLLTKYRSAIDYSNSSMTVAKSTLASISAFCHNAECYIRGQLQYQVDDEEDLWKGLADAQSSIRLALADDFDTPKAIEAIMGLVHHSNRQLQPGTKDRGLSSTSRSPAVFGAILSSIRDVLDVFGLGKKATHESSSSGNLQNIVELLARFRSEVRALALSPGVPAAGGKPRPLVEREPLLKACDRLRNDLAPLGVLLKDRGSNTTWEIIRHKPGTQKGE